MRFCWDAEAWVQYLRWQEIDPKMVRRINVLLKECARTPFTGTGKPEPLKGNYQGYWSRRITQEHRLVYKVQGEEVRIAMCAGHYQ